MSVVGCEWVWVGVNVMGSLAGYTAPANSIQVQFETRKQVVSTAQLKVGCTHTFETTEPPAFPLTHTFHARICCTQRTDTSTPKNIPWSRPDAHAVLAPATGLRIRRTTSDNAHPVIKMSHKNGNQDTKRKKVKQCYSHKAIN